MDIKNLHTKCMKKLHDIVGIQVILIYKNNMYSPIQVTATISDGTEKLLKSDIHIVGKKTKKFNILVKNILDNQGSIKNIDKIVYNFEEYQIQFTEFPSSIEDSLNLYGVLLDVE